MGSSGSGGSGGGGCVSTLPFVEAFSTWTPTGWSVVDGGSANGDSWLQCTPTSGDICNDYPFGLTDGWFAAVDADQYGQHADLLESLVTPSIDCSCDSSVVLEFAHLLHLDAGEHGDVDVSIGGGPWTTVASYSSNTSQNGAHILLDLSGWAAHQADVRIRFLYDETNDWGYTWMIDDVSVHP